VQEADRAGMERALPPIRLGLCCINNALRAGKPPVFCSRSLVRRTYTPVRALELARQNCGDLLALLQWNEAAQPPIRLFRVSSDLLPRFTDEAVERYPLDPLLPLLQAAGDFARAHGHRLLMHPGQYNQVGAVDTAVFARTVADLAYQACVLDALGVPPEDGLLIVHGGGAYGCMAEARERWVRQFARLPAGVQRRLVLENDERVFSVEDCLAVCAATGMRMVYDAFHDACWRALHPDVSLPPPADIVARVVATWPAGQRVVMHISEQREGARVGTHADFVHAIPPHLLSVPTTYARGLDLEVEAKAKEAAVHHLYRQYAHTPHAALFVEPHKASPATAAAASCSHTPPAARRARSR